MLKPSDAPYIAAESPAGPAPHDDEVELHPFGVDRRPGRLRELRVGGVVEDRAVREDDQRQLRVRTGLLHDGAAVLRVGQVERVRHRAAPQCLPELVRAPRPRLTDDQDGVGRGALGLGPLEQQAGDGVVEELVGRGRRPEDVVVDTPLGDRVEDGLAGGRITPLTPRDEQAAPRVRMEPAHLVEQIAAGLPVEPLRREHQGDVVAGFRQRLQTGERITRGTQAHDLVVAAVALGQLALDVAQPFGFVVDRDQRRRGHARILFAAPSGDHVLPVR